MEIDKKIIAKLINALEELKKSVKDLSDLKTYNNTNQNSSIEEDFSNNVIIKSPIVGTAYLAPEPGGKNFVNTGKKIKKGDTVLIVEAMKTMNHVPSPQDGIVKKVCVNDGEPVEFGQNLIILE